MKKKPIVGKLSFVLGIIFGLCLQFMHQSWLGQERYIQSVRDHWVSTSWWLWVFYAILVIVIDVAFVIREERPR